MQPHVFVVMPFGVKEAQSAVPATDNAPEKKAINISFDEVYDLLIKPALIKAGCVPFRADEESGAGDIRTDMYFELVTADVILADISILNANVFYELGVRHGVAPRGVLMMSAMSPARTESTMLGEPSLTLLTVVTGRPAAASAEAVPAVAVRVKPSWCRSWAILRTAVLSLSLTLIKTLPDCGSGEFAAICDLA